MNIMINENEENRSYDKKSIRFLKGKNTDWDDLAIDCVCFSNAQGGEIIIGIEDDEQEPPKDQIIEDRNIPEIIQKNIVQRSINVAVAATIEKAPNGGEYLKIQVFRNAQTIASTNNGKYYIRISDECLPIPPDELTRLAAEKGAYVWEYQTNKRVNKSEFDADKRIKFIRDIKSSERVSKFIKEKNDDEIFEYYFMQKNEHLTNLGILWIGKRINRASLLYPPAIQVIRYNENNEKVWKLLLDDYSLNPMELLNKVLSDVPDWQESIEISEGMFRKNIPFFPSEVVRELVANALVHRAYTTRGDIFINIFPDRLEIHSPGRLPFGVTPNNILNMSVRRNEHLSKVFYDLGLMEKEGSGYDLVYAQLLGSGKSIPIVTESIDRVTVVVKKQFISKEIVRLMDKANTEYNLNQKEIISLGLIAQEQSLSALEISRLLNQNQDQGLPNWLGRLLDLGLIEKSGIGKGTQYSINTKFVRKINFSGKTSLKNIEDHRLEELLFKDIESYPNSSFGKIHKRIGEEINIYKVRRILKILVKNDQICTLGKNRWVRYSIKKTTKNNQ